MQELVIDINEDLIFDLETPKKDRLLDLSVDLTKKYD